MKFAIDFSDIKRSGSSAKRIYAPTRSLPEIHNPSALPEVHTQSKAGAGAAAAAAAAADTVVEPVKGPTYDSDLALAKDLQREYDANAEDYRLGWGSNHPSVTKPKGAFPGMSSSSGGNEMIFFSFFIEN